MKSIIQTPTNNLATSHAFYTKLGFKTIQEKPLLVSDGKVIIEINDNRFARAGIKLFSANWEHIVNELKKITTVITIENGYLLSDTSGTWIYLIENDNATDHDLSQIPASTLGSYGGVSLETIGIEKSIELYTQLGFKKTMGSLEQGWIAFANEEGFGISLMKPNACPHLFFNPSVSYFNGKENLAIIEKIRKLEIPITEEITHFNKEGIVDNIIIRDPGGLGFFLFSD